MIARTLALVAAAALTASPARADNTAAPAPEAQQVQTVINYLKAGNQRTALTMMEKVLKLDALAVRPDLVHVLCDRAFRYDSEKTDPSVRTSLAARLHELATDAATRAPDDDRTRWALAESIILRERAGPRTGAAAWTQAADLLEKVYASHPGDSLPLGYAVSFLLEGACTDPDATMALSNRSEALAKRALDAQKDSPTLAVTIGTTQFWAGRTLIATAKKYARNQLRAALDTLKPFACRKSPVPEAATLFNDALEFSTQNGFKMDERFVMTPHLALDTKLLIDVPVSSRWTFSTVQATEDTPSYEYVTECDAAGRRLRQVIFRRYVGNQNYTFETAVPVGGNNVRGLAQGLQAMTAAKVFAPGAKGREPGKRVFAKAFGGGYEFDVAGRSADEKPEPLRVWGYLVGGMDQATYALLVYDSTESAELSPQMEAVVASMRPPE